MIVRTSLIRALLALALAHALRGQSTAILDDAFADGERRTQALPASLAWYTTNAAAGTIGVRNGGLTLVANNNDRRIWGYFPALELAIGDSLTFIVEFSLSRTPPNLGGPGFKFAMCHTSGLAPRRADGATPSGGYQGYGHFTNPGAATSGTRIRKRNGPAAAAATATLLEVTDATANLPVWDAIGDAGGLTGILQGETPYVAVLTITRIAVDSARITTSITGGALGPANTLTEIDPANIFTRFDTLAIEAAATVQAGDLVVARARLVHEVNTSRLTNLSILTDLTSSGDSFTMGYVVGGSGTSGAKPLVIRAAGPSLGALNVAGTLDDPRIELFAGTTKTGENDNWGGAAAISTAMAQVGAFPFLGATSQDAALLANITTPDNSVTVSATGNGTGTVIAELYDATPLASFTKSTPRLVNVSVLKHLGPALTVGFVIGGEGPKTVLVRAIGPTLGTAPFGVGGVVADPQLALFSGPTSVGTNDNWGGTATLTAAFAQVGAFALPASSRDAALVATLAPGDYTVRVSGVANTTGVALVEVYELP